MQITSRLSDALSKYLDLTTDQMKLTANNMANVDTPGFKTQGLDFQQAFSHALNGGTATLADSGVSSHLYKGHDVDGLVARPDGNNVSMDREGLELAKTQLQFRTGVELLKHEFSGIMTAIRADAK